MPRKKDYSKLSKDELIAIIEKLEKKKKYGLVWDAERVPEKVVLWFVRSARNGLT